MLRKEATAASNKVPYTDRIPVQNYIPSQRVEDRTPVQGLYVYNLMEAHDSFPQEEVPRNLPTVFHDASQQNYHHAPTAYLQLFPNNGNVFQNYIPPEMTEGRMPADSVNRLVDIYRSPPNAQFSQNSRLELYTLLQNDPQAFHIESSASHHAENVATSDGISRLNYSTSSPSRSYVTEDRTFSDVARSSRNCEFPSEDFNQSRMRRPQSDSNSVASDNAGCGSGEHSASGGRGREDEHVYACGAASKWGNFIPASVEKRYGRRQLSPAQAKHMSDTDSVSSSHFSPGRNNSNGKCYRFSY